MCKPKNIFLCSISTALIVISGCNMGGSSKSSGEFVNDSLELEKSKLEFEKEKLNLEKEKVRMDKEQLDRKAERNRKIEESKRASEFLGNPECIVVSETAHFFNAPDFATMRKGYLVKGDRFVATSVRGNFVYVEFYNAERDKTTTGWINMDDIEPLNY